MTIWQKTRHSYERLPKDDGRFYSLATCPIDGNLVMPFIGDMGRHDEGICILCNQTVKFVKIDEREIEANKKRLCEAAPVSGYNGCEVPNHFCINCNSKTIVKERRLRQRGNVDFVTGFVSCSMWERTGCRYTRPFTWADRDAIEAARAIRENQVAEF